MGVGTRLLAAMLPALLLLPGPAMAENTALSFGGDQYAAGQTASIATAVERDAFAAGYDVSVSAPVAGDAHVAGFNVTVSAPVTGNTYAIGFNVTVSATTGGDVSAFGNSVSLPESASIAGNLRAGGATVSLQAPVAGAALLAGQTVTLDAPVAGDFSFSGEKLLFGPRARVDGKLSIAAPNPIEVPASVASADRVSYTVLSEPEIAGRTGQTAIEASRGIWPAVWAAITWSVVLAVVGAIAIGLMPRTVAALETVSRERAWSQLGLGLVTFAAVLGLVPALAITVLGLLLVPFALVFAAIAWALAYLFGAYLVGMRLASAYAPPSGNVGRLVVLVLAVIVAAVLGSVPFLGWLVGLVLVLFGFGAFARAWMARGTAATATALPAA